MKQYRYAVAGFLGASILCAGAQLQGCASPTRSTELELRHAAIPEPLVSAEDHSAFEAELDRSSSLAATSPGTSEAGRAGGLTPAGLLGQDDPPAEPAEQDRLTKAIDSTATQWSFQLAWQGMDYKTDTVNGQPRPQGNDNFAQLRIVAPIPANETIPFRLLPRLTFRHYEAPDGKTGLGSTELFVLGIAKDWGTGRWGIGPLVEIPGSVGSDKFGYGLAGAIVNSSGGLYYGLLLTQAWKTRDPTLNPSGASPLGIAPFLNFQLGQGWYVGNGDMVIRYDWDNSAWYMPIGVRLGKVLVGEKSAWNFYAEYQTSLIYDDWVGSAVDNSIRLNVTYTLPVGL